MFSRIGFILGTGWGKIIKDIRTSKTESYQKIFGRTTSVAGHSGRAIFGKIFDKEVIILSGRFHTYEGYSPFEATKTVRYLHQQKVKAAVVTSACGALNPKYKVGDLVILTDLLTLFCQSPLSGPQFQDLSQPFSPKLIEVAEKAASRSKLSYQKGIYAYVKGPHYETFADKKALKCLGADVVGMSTVPEVIMANHLGMKVLGLSLITNLAFVKHSHKDVLVAGKNQEEQLYCFIKNLLKVFESGK